MWREGLRFTCPFSQPRRCDLTRHTLTLYLLLLLPIVSASVREVIIFPDKTDDGETCRPLGGGDGECLDLFLCPSVVSTFKKVHPALCGFRGKVPIVCCPKSFYMEQPRPTSPYPTQPLPPPAVDVKCGLGGSSKKKRPPKLAGLIGGVEAKPNSWPWVAAVGSIERGGKVNWFCDGVLITPQFVLTAGHCVWYFEVDLVRLGGHNLTTRRPAQVDVRVSVTTLHPLYSPPSLAHDLAILRLDHPVKLSSQVSPVCLPWTVKDSPDLEGRSFTLVGWGATRFGGAGSDVLREVDVTVFPPSRCDAAYKTLGDYSIRFPDGIGDDFLCAGDRQGGKDACKGDSGGPLMYNSFGRYMLAGVVSAGYKCGLINFPGIYTATCPHLQWIRKVAFSTLTPSTRLATFSGWHPL